MNKPDMSGVEWARRFKGAVAYARAAMSNPQKRAVYARAAAGRGKRPFDLAVSDYSPGKELVS